MPADHHFWRDPALPFLEGRRAVGSLSCYAPHSHPTFSIGVVDAGASTFTLAGCSERIVPGDVVLVRAHDVHCCNPDDLQRWSYRMFHIDPRWVSAVLPHPLPSQVIRSPEALQLLGRMTVALERGRQQDEVVTCLRQLMVLCAAIARTAPAVSAPPCAATSATTATADLQRAYDYLQLHCHERVDLDTLAQVAGIGRYQLIRRFRSRYGLTPHALQLDMKVNQARALLQRGGGTADTAYDTGFADQSHFHRVFKSRVAATPSQYRDG